MNVVFLILSSSSKRDNARASERERAIASERERHPLTSEQRSREIKRGGRGGGGEKRGWKGGGERNKDY